MDRTREARRSAMAASNGLSRRRQRTSGMDERQAEIQHEGLRLRDRLEKKERDRDSLNRSKRRRSERFVQRNERDVEENSSDESLGDDDVPVSQNSASFQQNYLRKGFPPSRLPRHAAATGVGPSLKVADEMIGVPVPRKARSVCVKRSHDCRTSSGSGGGGFGEDHRRAPASPASHSLEAVSPSSSNVSVKQKMKSTGSKTRVPKPPKSSGTAEDDLEIEIAEVLSGLKKQPRDSKKEDDSENSLKSAEFMASKKMKTEGDESSARVENSSISCTVKTENGYAVNAEISMAKPEKSSGFNSEPHRTAGTEATDAALAAVDMQNEVLKQEKSVSPVGVENKHRYDLQDSTVTKGVSEGPLSQSQREEANCPKFEIDLMVPPPMPSSPERDSLRLASDPKLVAQDYNKLESLVNDKDSIIVKKEVASEEVVEKKVDTCEWLKLDLKKSSQDNLRDSGLRLQNLGRSPQQPAKSATVMPLPVAVGGWPNGLPLGYMPPFETAKPVEGITGSSPAVQAAPFSATQPRPKRCAMHYFIARNIQLHQQFIKTNQLWPPNTGSVPMKGGGSRPNNLCVMSPTAAEGLIHGNTSLNGSFPVLSLNSLARDKGSAVASVSTQKDKASESGNPAETTQKKLQHPAASANLLPGPAFIFPVSHHQQPVIGTAYQSAPSKVKTPSLAGGPASVSFSYPSSSASEASPYFTILPNNGFTFQAPSAAVRGGTPGQALPLYSGSLYSSQMFQSSQLQPKQGQVYKETSTSGGSSSSHKQPHPQVGGSSLLSSVNVQKQPVQSTAHQSPKLEMKTSGENSSVVSDPRGSHSQKAYGQNTTGVPLQPLNFSMSFGSFSGSGTPSNLNFSSNGYHIVPVPQATHQKSHQVSDSKTGGSSINLDDQKRAILGKPPAITNGQTLVFDNSARTLSFASGSWPSRAVTATAMNSNPPVSTSLPNSQQHQTQKHHMSQQQQHQQQQSGRSKLMATNTLPATSLGSKFPNSVSVFPQTHTQMNPVPAKSAQWKSPPASSSLASCSSLNLKQFQTQQQIRTQGQTQISFAGTPKPVLVQPLQMQQEKSSGIRPQTQPPSLVVGSSPHNKTNSAGSNKIGSPLVTATAVQPQQPENSGGGTSQKSSPVCGRNVPSIISSCPGHMSELKY